jgi:hypothetical protein
MLNQRVFNIVWITRDNPVKFDPEIIPHESVDYKGEEVVIKKSIKKPTE